MLRKLLYIYAFLILSGPCIFAQSGAVEGVVRQEESAARYEALKAKQDSITVRISRIRELYVSDTDNRSAYSAEMADLESELFRLRDSLSYYSELMGRLRPGAQGYGGREAAVRNNPDIIYNSYFMNNLSPDDFKALEKAHSAEKDVETYMRAIRHNYWDMYVADTLYRQADKSQADSLYAELMRISRQNSLIVDSMSQTWNDVFDTKVYLYNYILDKNNESSLL